MANSLNKYGVPVPNGTNAPMKQPKPKYRFRVLFFGFGTTEDGDFITIDTNTVSSPTVEHENVTVHSYNSSTHYKGKYTWNTIELAFRDSIGNLSLKAIYNQMRKEFNYYSQESRTSASQYKFEMWIQALDGSNSESTTDLYQGTLHTWICQSCFIQDSNFGDWDYSDSNPQAITMTIQPDGCVLVDNEGNPLGDAVTGNGTPENSVGITSSKTNISSNTLQDSNFYED